MQRGRDFSFPGYWHSWNSYLDLCDLVIQDMNLCSEVKVGGGEGNMPASDAGVCRFRGGKVCILLAM